MFLYRNLIYRCNIFFSVFYRDKYRYQKYRMPTCQQAKIVGNGFLPTELTALKYGTSQKVFFIRLTNKKADYASTNFL